MIEAAQPRAFDTGECERGAPVRAVLVNKTDPTILVPICTWLLMGYFKTIPKELEECARIDGATRWKAMLYIIFPLAVPGIISAGIFAFTLSWNEFIYALVFLSTPDEKTISVGVTSELVRDEVARGRMVIQDNFNHQVHENMAIWEECVFKINYNCGYYAV